jgi:hypothetical protein
MHYALTPPYKLELLSSKMSSSKGESGVRRGPAAHFYVTHPNPAFAADEQYNNRENSEMLSDGFLQASVLDETTLQGNKMGANAMPIAVRSQSFSEMTLESRLRLPSMTSMGGQKLYYEEPVVTNYMKSKYLEEPSESPYQASGSLGDPDADSKFQSSDDYQPLSLQGDSSTLYACQIDIEDVSEPYSEPVFLLGGTSVMQEDVSALYSKPRMKLPPSLPSRMSLGKAPAALNHISRFTDTPF